MHVMGRSGVQEETLLCSADEKEKFPLYWRRDARTISPLSIAELSPLDWFDVEFLEKFHADSRVLIEKERDSAFLQGYFSGCLSWLFFFNFQSG